MHYSFLLLLEEPGLGTPAFSFLKPFAVMTATPFDTLRYSGCGCHNGRMASQPLGLFYNGSEKPGFLFAYYLAFN
jgi:hypothetical protein